MQKLSIIVPVLNEEKTISRVLEKLYGLVLPGWEKELLIVDDGSTDQTQTVIRDFVVHRQPANFLLLTHKTNQGKGQAVKTALAAATGSYIIIQDADLEYDPNDIPKMLRALDEERADAVFGSRNLMPKRRGYPHYVLGVKILTVLTNLLFGSDLTDVYTCYKLIPAQAMKELALKSKGFEFEAEVTTKLLKRKLSIFEIPISYDPRSFADGKKIKWQDGLSGIWTIIKNRL